MNFKQLDSAKEHESERNKGGISIRKKIPLLNGILVLLSMSAICIFTYIKSAQMISNQESMRQAVNELSGGIYTIALIVIIISILVGIVLSRAIMLPLSKVTLLIEKTSKLDLSDDEDIEALIKIKDEFGTIARTIVNMRKTLKDVVKDLIEASENISDNEHTVEELTSILKIKTEESSSETETLSAGMEETAATAQEISASSGEMKNMV
ncbi:MAG: hypothetical protein ACREV6_06000, partial [Clostridium sp.]